MPLPGTRRRRTDRDALAVHDRLTDGSRGALPSARVRFAVPLAVSFGVAVFPGGGHAAEVMPLADERLFRAKGGGKEETRRNACAAIC